MTHCNLFAHPVVSSTGYIYYKYYPYSCSESKSWEALTHALSITIPKICNSIYEDRNQR